MLQNHSFVWKHDSYFKVSFLVLTTFSPSVLNTNRFDIVHHDHKQCICDVVHCSTDIHYDGSKHSRYGSD